MALSFPNRSRSYDERGRRVRFWGYDGALEISFFVEQRAFARISPNIKLDEAGFLGVFDRYRGCSYEYRKWQATGSRYWRSRYHDCRSG